MEHIKEFNLFGKNKPLDGPNENLRLFLENNWKVIEEIFGKNDGLKAERYEVYSGTIFAISYDPPNNEMPAEISYIVEGIKNSISHLIGDPDMKWRFGIDDPFLIRFILSKPY